MRIILVGFMGCGKTSVGKKLARKMHYDFFDTDEWIERSAGMSIQRIFDQHGEDHFRDLEKQCIEKLADLPEHTIISTGGGLPCTEENIEALKGLGIIVYLKLSANELAKRLMESKTERPLIKTYRNEEQLKEFIHQKLETRSLYYEQAHLIPKGKEQRIPELLSKISEYQMNL